MSDTNSSITSSAEYMAPLNDTQYFVMWGVATIPCILSWIGSFSIMYIARRKIRSSVYHRILFIISAIDFTNSLWGYWNVMLMNSETGYKLSMGNQATCTSVGFLMMFSLISKAFYSCYIALYFMLSVRYQWSDKRVMRYEAMAYLIAFFVPMSYGITGFINEAFNPNEFRFCSIAKYPIGCQGDECIRGNLARTFWTEPDYTVPWCHFDISHFFDERSSSLALISTLSTCTTLLVSVCAIAFTVLLFYFVRHQTKQSTRHDFRSRSGNTNVISSSFVVAVGNTDTTVPNTQKQIDRSLLVRTQSILYVAANINNFIWLLLFNRLVLNSLDSDDIHDRDSIVFASGILLFLFMPMYGFFNYCIFCYPRLRRIQGHFPEKSFWWCLRLLYTKDQGESEITQQRLLKRLNQQSQRNILNSSFGAISFSGALDSLDHATKPNNDHLESAATQSLHHSGNTAIVISSDDEDDIEINIDTLAINPVTNSDMDDHPPKSVTSLILQDEEMQMVVADDADRESC